MESLFLTNIPFFCEILVDQGRFIGSDPVGYRCSNAAKFEAPEGFLVCEECVAMMKAEPTRITLPKPPFGRNYQQKLCDEATGRINS